MDMVAVDFGGGRSPGAVDPRIVERKVEARGHRAPPSYVAFAVVNGGKRFPSSSRFIRNGDTGEVVGITTIYHYDPELPLYSVDDVWAQTQGQVPAGLLPIASTEFSGEVCLDYRSGGVDPSVVLYDYEAAPGREITGIAADFDAFLAAIGPNPDR